MAIGDEQIDRLLNGLHVWSDDLVEKLRLLLNGIKVTNTTTVDAPEVEKAQPPQ